MALLFVYWLTRCGTTFAMTNRFLGLTFRLQNVTRVSATFATLIGLLTGEGERLAARSDMRVLILISDS
jgi:hypothetical protein